MSILTLVAVSGTVGKQIYTSAKKVYLKSVTLTPSGANATVKIRHGQAPTSAEIVFFGRAPSAFGSKQFEIDKMLFSQGLHVTVIGTAAQAYLELE